MYVLTLHLLYPAANYPPNITEVESIEVQVGELFTLQLEAEDPDGDDVVFELLEEVEGASITENGTALKMSPLTRKIGPISL